MTVSFFLIVLAFATPFPIIYGYFNTTNDSQNIREINKESKSSCIYVKFIFTNFFFILFAAPVTYLWHHLGKMQHQRIAQQFPFETDEKSKVSKDWISFLLHFEFYVIIFQIL